MTACPPDISAAVRRALTLWLQACSAQHDGDRARYKALAALAHAIVWNAGYENPHAAAPLEILGQRMLARAFLDGQLRALMVSRDFDGWRTDSTSPAQPSRLAAGPSDGGEAPGFPTGPRVEPLTTALGPTALAIAAHAAASQWAAHGLERLDPALPRMLCAM